MARSQPEQVEFFFDLSSAFSYVAASQIDTACARAGARAIWRPVFAAAVFQATGNTATPSMAAPKLRWLEQDLRDWCEDFGLPLLFPPLPFPVDSRAALRLLVSTRGQAGLKSLAGALFSMYWAEQRDISTPEALAEAMKRSGVKLSGERNDAGPRLRANTNDLLAAGGFGVPHMLWRGKLYFGNDRIERLVRDLVRRKRE